MRNSARCRLVNLGNEMTKCYCSYLHTKVYRLLNYASIQTETDFMPIYYVEGKVVTRHAHLKKLTFAQRKAPATC